MKNLIVLLFTLAMLTTHGQIKWASVESVYNDLITAIGDGSKIAPPIEASRTESRVAYYSPSRQTVFVENKFLAICETLGPDSLNALAFILGHELAHFYRNHGWVSASGMGYIDAEMKAEWKSMKSESANRAKDESEADIFSGFYALIAGYNAMPVAEKTLKALYLAYGIPDSIPGYPTLGQRVGIAENAMAKSRTLYLQFNVGIYCLATEKYSVASKIFTAIYNNDYAGSEILNNLALAEILQGYQILGESPSYYYPVFISTETPLDPNSRGSEGEEHIRSGIAYLKEALKKEENSISIFTNLASAYAMLNEYVDAEYYIAKMEAIDPLNSAAICLRGIIAAKKGDNKMAKNYWKKHLKDDLLSAKNYAAHFEKGKEAVFAEAKAKTAATQMVDDVDLNSPSFKSNFNFEVVKLPGLKISYVELEKSTIIEVYGGSGIDYRFQQFNSDNFETSNFAWQKVLQSTDATVQNSAYYNVLKLSKGSTTIPTYVKYVWY